MGPLVYAKHLVSGSRLPFTAAYFGSIAMTLYFAIGVSALISLSLCAIPAADDRHWRFDSVPPCRK
jgi:hypothetical protein